MFQMALLLLKDNNCQIIFKSMHKYTSYGPHKLNFWSSYHMTLMCDLDRQPTWKNVPNVTPTPQGQQLCQIILKSMNKCRSYSLDKLNLWPFYHLTLKVILIFNLLEQMFQMALLLFENNNYATLFWNPCTNVQVMAQTNPDGHMYIQHKMQAHTQNWNCNNCLAHHKLTRKNFVINLLSECDLIFDP